MWETKRRAKLQTPTFLVNNVYLLMTRFQPFYPTFMELYWGTVKIMKIIICVVFKTLFQNTKITKVTSCFNLGIEL